ncbi:hypothetical protein LCGC14_0395570 [marine sediment metagenome]|uniref:Uncharacterized protein n=1 Tax=marine sediment metagenome TaxID=412755 RepID=A0A0F9VKF5_9ZZZZ
MPRKTHRKYEFIVKRSNVETEMIFTTTAKSDREAITRLEKCLQMSIGELLKIEPKSVSKPIYRKEGYAFTKGDVDRIKKGSLQAKQSTINLIPFPYLHEGLLRTMIQKLKRKANAKE